MDNFLISISLKIESLIDDNMLNISKSDDDIINKIKRSLEVNLNQLFKETCSKYPYQ